jgi:hypothetical protein
VVLMLRCIAGGLGLVLIVVGGIFLGEGGGLIGGSFVTGRGRWAVTGAVMIAFGICVLARGQASRPGSEGDDGARRDPSGLPLAGACGILEEINASGGNAT